MIGFKGAVVVGVIGVLATMTILAKVLFFGDQIDDVADDFFVAAQERYLSTAREHLSEAFNATTDDKALREFLFTGPVAAAKDTSWTSRVVHEDQGELIGSLVMANGGVVPIRMSFVRENDEWKIYGIQKPAAGLHAAKVNSARFANRGLREESMQEFMATVAHTTLEDLQDLNSKAYASVQAARPAMAAAVNGTMESMKDAKERVSAAVVSKINALPSASSATTTPAGEAQTQPTSAP